MPNKSGSSVLARNTGLETSVSECTEVEASKKIWTHRAKEVAPGGLEAISPTESQVLSESRIDLG